MSILDLQIEKENAEVMYMSNLECMDEYWDRFDDQTIYNTVKHYVTNGKAKDIPYALKELVCSIADIDLIKILDSNMFYFHYIDWADGNGPFSKYRKIRGLTRKDVNAIVYGGNLEALQWLHDTKPCSMFLFSKSTMDEASCVNRLDIMEWLHNNRKEGCTKRALEAAIVNRNYDIINWLLQNKREDVTPKDFRFDDFVEDSILDKNDLEMIMFLEYKHIPYFSPEIMDKSFQKSRDIFMYFHQKGYKCSTNVMDHAILKNDLTMVKWLNENRKERCSFFGLVTAIERENDEMFLYTTEHVSQNGLSKHNVFSLIQIAVEKKNMEMIRHLSNLDL